MMIASPLDQFRLDNRVVLLTGATGHIGIALAHSLVQAGARLVLNARNLERLKALQQQLDTSVDNIMLTPFDVGDSEAASRAIKDIENSFGRLDVIINNAYSGRANVLENSTENDFDMACRQNISGPFMLIQKALPLLKHAGEQNPGGASIINMASMYGHVSPDPRIYGDSGSNNPPYYGAAKAGLIQLSRYLAAHLGPYNIRVNAISPGPFPPMSVKDNQPGFYELLCKKVPLERIGVVDELVGPVLFLASDASSYVSGINLAVDGGWTCW